jgi:hypothetical protein
LPFNTSRPYTEFYRSTDQGNERLGKVENEIGKAASMRISNLLILILVALPR